jgi:hypothetical protein
MFLLPLYAALRAAASSGGLFVVSSPLMRMLFDGSGKGEGVLERRKALTGGRMGVYGAMETSRTGPTSEQGEAEAKGDEAGNARGERIVKGETDALPTDAVSIDVQESLRRVEQHQSGSERSVLLGREGEKGTYIADKDNGSSGRWSHSSC